MVVVEAAMNEKKDKNKEEMKKEINSKWDFVNCTQKRSKSFDCMHSLFLYSKKESTFSCTSKVDSLLSVGAAMIQNKKERENRKEKE